MLTQEANHAFQFRGFNNPSAASEERSKLVHALGHAVDYLNCFIQIQTEFCDKLLHKFLCIIAFHLGKLGHVVKRAALKLVQVFFADGLEQLLDLRKRELFSTVPVLDILVTLMWPQVLGPDYDFFDCVALCHADHVAPTAFVDDGADFSMEAPVRHPLLNAWIYCDDNVASRLVLLQQLAESYLSSFSGFLR